VKWTTLPVTSTIPYQKLHIIQTSSTFSYQNSKIGTTNIDSASCICSSVMLLL